VVRSHPGQIVHKTLFRKSPLPKKAGGVAQGVGPEFKPQYHKEKKKSLMKPSKINKSRILLAKQQT
jgi:hypothetical protein